MMRTTTEYSLPLKVQTALDMAWRWDKKHGYARAYINAMSEAMAMSDDREHAAKVQVLYILNNIAGWRGEEAKAHKAVLRLFSKQGNAAFAG